MKYGLRSCLLLCFGLASFHSMAMATNYVSVSCGQQHVAIKSDYFEGALASANSSRFYLRNYGQANECRLKSGHVVRVRFGFGFYGESQNQRSWVSVWFDRKKWLSTTDVEVIGPNDVRADSIDISAQGVEVCTAHGPMMSDADDGSGKKQTPVCKFTAREQLSNAVDAKEPRQLDASENPLVSPTILLGWGNPLCKAMSALNQDTLKSGVELGGHLWLNFSAGQLIRIRQEPGSVTREWAVSDKIDIDNSGADEHVYYRLQLMGYWENYDIYVVLDDAGYQRFLRTAMTDKDLLESAEAVWPMDWSGHPNRLEASRIMDALAISLSRNENLIEKVDMPDNKVRIFPFLYHGQTYLLLSQYDGLGFVVKPHPAGKFDQKCVFQAGITNF